VRVVPGMVKWVGSRMVGHLGRQWDGQCISISGGRVFELSALGYSVSSDTGMVHGWVGIGIVSIWISVVGYLGWHWNSRYMRLVG